MQDDEPSSASPLPESDPERKPFTPEVLDRSLIAMPLLWLIRDQREKGGDPGPQHVIIDLNLQFKGDRHEAKALVREAVEAIAPGSIDTFKSDLTEQYLFALLTLDQIRALAQRIEADAERLGSRPAHRIWLDHAIKSQTNASVSTIKGDAARNAFSSEGAGIVWAVADTGIDATHPHFSAHRNLDLDKPLQHRDFTKPGQDDEASATEAQRDVAGHGTHVAGIIAGEFVADDGKHIVAHVRRRRDDGEVELETVKDIPRMSGVAPKTKLLSLKVLDDDGNGLSSNLIAAIAYIQRLNNHGRRVRVHGLNMSVGYDFDPEWFACGQSPLCVEVDRLVKSGVSVVVAAGNTGYGWVQSASSGARSAGLDLTINDPGNADLAITVGSTHRDMPHVYGVSYFSSKGPTGDGRLKPDLVAPGEKILSSRSGQKPPENSRAEAPAKRKGSVVAAYHEDSGTSMAAPHVSGAIAAFLSVRREFIGRPEPVRAIFMDSATDLKRDIHFQGRGLVDLMRALQSV